MTEILLIGSGGVGTIASLALEQHGKARVTSVLRSDYEKVLEKGFQIKSPDYGNKHNWRPTRVVKSISEAKTAVGEFDYVVVCIKVIPEIIKTEDVIRDAISPKTKIVLIQNGIDIEEPVSQAFPGNIVLSGVSMIGVTNRHGVIEQLEHDALQVGYYYNKALNHETQVFAAKSFVELYGNKASYNDDIFFARWRKLVYNSSLNTISALTLLDTGRLYLSGLDKSIVLPAMKEVITIANKALESHNKKLPDGIDVAMLLSDDGTWYKPSMYVDVEKGNPIELEPILGNVLRESQRLKVDAPILTVIYHLLKGIQFGLLEKRGEIKCEESPPVRAKTEPIWK